MKELDLHTISHDKAEIIIEEFIIKNYTKLPVQIITGNSIDMQNILTKIIIKHNLRMNASHPDNLGSYIVTEKL
ncbi:MAG: hypothetical protein CMG66_04855 [Candidatus Marinimicrobia bacterium]|nr:hypothetical protein [Candidatus Neomarinimicrobiota bacterium]|tara:strand:- start:27949 stop:28170 length:222 start_codon:yes stop_codon:yes gene_type:complete